MIARLDIALSQTWTSVRDFFKQLFEIKSPSGATRKNWGTKREPHFASIKPHQIVGHEAALYREHGSRRNALRFVMMRLMQ